MQQVNTGILIYIWAYQDPRSIPAGKHSSKAGAAAAESVAASLPSLVAAAFVQNAQIRRTKAKVALCIPAIALCCNVSSSTKHTRYSR